MKRERAKRGFEAFFQEASALGVGGKSAAPAIGSTDLSVPTGIPADTPTADDVGRGDDLEQQLDALRSRAAGTFPEARPHRLKTFYVSEETLRRLQELRQVTGEPYTRLLEVAVGLLHRQVLGSSRQA